MAQINLNMQNLGEIDDGAACVIIDQAIAEAVHDLDDRGADGQTRSVMIQINLKQMDNGLVETHVEAAAKIPKRRTHSTVAKIKREGDRSRLLFQQYAPDDPNQRTLDEAENQNKE